MKRVLKKTIIFFCILVIFIWLGEEGYKESIILDKQEIIELDQESAELEDKSDTLSTKNKYPQVDIIN